MIAASVFEISRGKTDRQTNKQTNQPTKKHINAAKHHIHAPAVGVDNKSLHTTKWMELRQDWISQYALHKCALGLCCNRQLLLQYDILIGSSRLQMLTLTRSCVSDALKNQSSLMSSSSMMSCNHMHQQINKRHDRVRLNHVI